MSILADVIFMNPRYDQYEDYGETQSYYDLRTGIIYVVMEEYGMSGNNIIQEITPDSAKYKANYARYKKAKGIKEKYRVTYTAQVDQTIEATSLEEAKKIAKNGTGEYENQAFENIYLSEVAFITDKDGNEV